VLTRKAIHEGSPVVRKLLPEVLEKGNRSTWKYLIAFFDLGRHRFLLQEASTPGALREGGKPNPDDAFLFALGNNHHASQHEMEELFINKQDESFLPRVIQSAGPGPMLAKALLIHAHRPETRAAIFQVLQRDFVQLAQNRHGVDFVVGALEQLPTSELKQLLETNVNDKAKLDEIIFKAPKVAVAIVEALRTHASLVDLADRFVTYVHDKLFEIAKDKQGHKSIIALLGNSDPPARNSKVFALLLRLKTYHASRFQHLEPQELDSIRKIFRHCKTIDRNGSLALLTAMVLDIRQRRRNSPTS